MKRLLLLATLLVLGRRVYRAGRSFLADVSLVLDLIDGRR